MLVFDNAAQFRDAGLGCLGTYRCVRIAIGPLYISVGWRVRR